MIKKRLPAFLVMVTFLLICSSTFLYSGEDSKLKRIAGTGNAGFLDGKNGEMNKPIRLVPFDENSVIIADINNHAIRIISLDGNITTLAGGPEKQGYRDGPVSQALFNSPHGVAHNRRTGEIYIAEAGNHTIRLLTPAKKGATEYSVSTFAGVPDSSGFKDGLTNEALFSSPHAIVLSPEGDIIVADIGNARIRLVRNEIVTTIAGSGAHGQNDGTPLTASFKYPMDLVFSKDILLIADAGTHRIRELLPGNEVTTLKLQGELKTPHGIAIDHTGMIYIADMGTHRILAIHKNGSVEVIAGTGEAGSEIYQLNKPAAVLVHSNLLWIADLNNHQIKTVPLKIIHKNQIKINSQNEKQIF